MKANDEPVVVEQIFPASIKTVWNALTELNEMHEWYFEMLPDFKAEPGFKTQFAITNKGKPFTHLWEVTEVVPPNKITYLWKFKEYPGEGLVTFELSEQAGATKLKLINWVTKDFPDNIPELAPESCVAGWEYFIQNRLKEYLAQKGQGK